MPIRPATQKDQIVELWDDIRGENGGGIKEIVRADHETIGEMKVDIAEIKGIVAGHMGTSKPPIKIIALKKLLEVFLAACGFAIVVGLFLLVVGGKVTADDIADILKAWKGVP